MAKLLDFGLAKAIGGEVGDASTTAEVDSAVHTEAGVVLGTAQAIVITTDVLSGG